MKVALFEKVLSLIVASKPLRELRANEVLVKVQSCGVCGTDVHIVEGSSRSTPPVVLGHEFVGIVEDVGSDVHHIARGQHVAVDPNIACGMCYYCRRGLVHLCTNLRALGVDLDGGMAEFCMAPMQQVYVLPERMKPGASVYVEPVSCAIHGIDRANISIGDTVVIIGGGTIGLLMLQLAKNAGAARTILVEPLEYKRRIATELGAEIVINPKETDTKSSIMDVTDVGADVVIECAGTPPTAQLSLELARRGGTVEFFGVCSIGEKIRLEPNQVYFNELTIVGSYVNPNTFSRAIALLDSGKVRVDNFHTTTFPLEEVHKALAFQREGKTIKCIIEPNR